MKTDTNMRGALLENFVAMELTKQLTWSETRARLFHFRTTAGREVDLVLEDSAGRIVGIEVKAAGSVGDDDFRGLRALQEAAGDRFHRGIVLHDGEEGIQFAPQLMAAPLDWLWRV
jgi:predicted AAA+ superfamily ATPase